MSATPNHLGPVRLRDVAERAGVSVGTVSKVLNAAAGSALYSEECRQRVLAAASELGYTPNYLARSLQTGRASAIGLVWPVGWATEDDTGFWAFMISGIDQETRQRGHQFVILGADPGQPPLDAGLRSLRERRVDGLIAPGFIFGRAGPPEALGQDPAPIVLVEYAGETDLPVVELDDAAGVAAAVRHLVELGHRRLYWIGPDHPGDIHVQRRRAAALDAARAPGVELRPIMLAPAPDDAGHRSIEAAIDRLRLDLAESLGKDDWATAVVTYDEATAIAACAALRDAGRSVPGDVSVIGMDDIYARAAYPPMTVVSHMLHRIGRTAARLVFDMVHDPAAWQRLRGHRERIPAELVIRKSTAKPRIH